jgi:hypothetical protein
MDWEWITGYAELGRSSIPRGSNVRVANHPPGVILRADPAQNAFSTIRYTIRNGEIIYAEK